MARRLHFAPARRNDMTRLVRTVTLIAGLTLGATAFAAGKPAAPAPGSTPAAATKPSKEKRASDKKSGKHKSEEHKQQAEHK
jgi:hypothetical protein